MKKNILIYFTALNLFLLGFFAMSFLRQNGKESTKVLVQLQNPNNLLTVWNNVLIPLNACFAEEIAYQKQLKEAEDVIMTYTPSVYPFVQTRTTAKKIAIEKINNKELLILINNQRVKGCRCGNIYYPPTHPVKWNYKLELAASKYSKYMKKNNHFSHYDLNVGVWGTRISKEGYDWSLCAENIAKDIKTSKIVVEFWLKNTADCINLMSPKYVDIGVGRYEEYWTILFARKFKLSNCHGC